MVDLKSYYKLLLFAILGSIIIFYTTDVNALTLGAPETFTYFSDGTEVTGRATSIGYWGSENYWKSASKIGSFTNSSPNAHSVQFYWNGANLCQNKNISISGTIAVLSNFFDEQAYSTQFIMNGTDLSCSITRENSSRIRYTCFGNGGGSFQIFFRQNSFNGSYRNYDIAVSKDVDLSCDSSNTDIIQNNIQNTQDIINNQNSNTQELKDTMTDESTPNTNTEINDLNNQLISDTPITDLITLPLTLLNAYLTGVSGTCNPVNLGNLYGTNLSLPCINLEQRLGANLWTIIDSLVSIFMIYNIAMLMIQAFEGFTSLRDDYDSLYQPKHADTGYQPKHGGGN